MCYAPTCRNPTKAFINVFYCYSFFESVREYSSWIAILKIKILRFINIKVLIFYDRWNGVSCFVAYFLRLFFIVLPHCFRVNKNYIGFKLKNEIINPSLITNDCIGMKHIILNLFSFRVDLVNIYLGYGLFIQKFVFSFSCAAFPCKS